MPPADAPGQQDSEWSALLCAALGVSRKRPCFLLLRNFRLMPCSTQASPGEYVCTNNRLRQMTGRSSARLPENRSEYCGREQPGETPASSRTRPDAPGNVECDHPPRPAASGRSLLAAIRPGSERILQQAVVLSVQR